MVPCYQENPGQADAAAKGAGISYKNLVVPCYQKNPGQADAAVMRFKNHNQPHEKISL